MITTLLITIFVAYSYADPADRSTENREHEERHNQDPDEYYKRHHHREELHNDTEEFHHHHDGEIEEDRYHRHCCH